MKDELIIKLIEANKTLFSTFEKMSDDVRIDKWSKREIMAHIAGWYEEAIDATEKVLKGEKPMSFKYSLDGFNKRNIEKRKDLAMEEILVEADTLHKKFIEQLKSLDEIKMKNYFGTKLGKKQINVLWVIEEIISHDTNHAKEIKKTISL